MVVSTSRLPSHFRFGWIATCVVFVTHSGGGAIFSYPRTSTLSVESRSVPVVVSTSRLPSHFRFGWIATCVVFVTHSGGLLESPARFCGSKGRFSLEDIYIYRYRYVLLRKVYAPHNVGVFQTFYVCTNYSLQSNSSHEMFCCQNGVLDTGSFWRVKPNFK